MSLTALLAPPGHRWQVADLTATGSLGAVGGAARLCTVATTRHMLAKSQCSASVLTNDLTGACSTALRRRWCWGVRRAPPGIPHRGTGPQGAVGGAGTGRGPPSVFVQTCCSSL